MNNCGLPAGSIYEPGRADDPDARLLTIGPGCVAKRLLGFARLSLLTTYAIRPRTDFSALFSNTHAHLRMRLVGARRFGSSCLVIPKFIHFHAGPMDP
jgi:hypothetical protein